MRERPLTVFFAGFACGLVFLTLLLWQTGILRTTNASAAPGRPQEIQTPARTPDARRTRPAQTALPDLPLMQRGLMVPVEGVHAADLQDNFNQMRGGHRHEALDIMAPRGTPVLAADEGTVVKLFISKPGGLTVYQFDDSRTYCYYYAHLDRYAPGLQEGAFLRKGGVLGYVGSTGNASPDAPHLHFGIFKLGPEQRWWEGAPINPYEFLGGSPAK
ncbi:MAG TPA: M23 family metallopeptidase [Bryobacteraceae bacterium]|nr:M23 family metallopeptidase [Bryobacteraceae bacterium]